jgi:replicative DNA helicase
MHDNSVEQSALCSFILNAQDGLNSVFKYHITPQHFVNPFNLALFETIMNMCDIGAILTRQSILNRIKSEQHFQNADEYLAEIMNLKETNPRYWMELLDKYMVSRNAMVIIDNAKENLGNVHKSEDVLQQTTEDLFHLLASIRQVDEDIGTIKDMTTVGGYPSVFNTVNRKIVNYPKKFPVVLGARPGVGKTTYLCLETIGHVIRKNADWYKYRKDRHAVIFSLEMPRKDLYRKMICILSGIDERKVKANKMTPEEKTLFGQYFDLFKKAPIFIYDRPATPNQICSNMRFCADRYKTTMFGLDYAQRMKAHLGGRKDRQFFCDASNYIADTLKNLPVDAWMLILSQLSRSADINRFDSIQERKRNTPRLSHFKETGALEEDAYLAGVLYPDPEFIHLDLDEQPVLLDWLKNRGGPTGQCPMIFHKSKQKFKRRRGE